MRFRRSTPDTLELLELNSICCDLLQKVVPSANLEGHPAAEARLLSSPTSETNPELTEDWKEFVEPDLREHFLVMQKVVEEDLAPIREARSNALRTLQIPMEHLDSWIHALNQARLALTARFGFSEAELEGDLPLLEEERTIALFEVHFFGVLQEAFLRQVDPPAN